MTREQNIEIGPDINIRIGDKVQSNSETLTFYTLKIYSKNMLPKFRTSRNLCGVLLSMPGLGLFFSADFFRSHLCILLYLFFSSILYFSVNSRWYNITLAWIYSFFFKPYEAFLTSKTFNEIQSKNCLDKIMFFLFNSFHIKVWFIVMNEIFFEWNS